MKQLGRITMDSTKIRIPIRDTSYISESITSKWILVNEATGEVKDWKGKAYFHESDGIKFRVALEKQPGRNGNVREYLTILLTAKMLEGKYLEGITLENVSQVYSYIMDTGLAKFPFDAMKAAECTDTDLKNDFENRSGKQIISYLQENTNPIKSGRAATPFREKMNQGIQWSERKSTAFKTNPYLKVYSKHLDLLSKSKVFADTYGIEVPEDYWRVETTVKNKKHWRTFGIEDTSLESLLSLSEDIKETIMQQAMKAHLFPSRSQRRASEGLSPKDRGLYNLILFCIELGQPYGVIEARYLQGQTKDNKSRKKKHLETIYREHILKTEIGKESEKLDQSLQNMGFYF